MIAEAIDTLITLGWALLAWIVLTATVVTIALWTVVVAVAYACRAFTRGVKAALAAVQRLKAPELPPEPQRASQRRLSPHAPSWAHTDKEAA